MQTFSTSNAESTINSVSAPLTAVILQTKEYFFPVTKVLLQIWGINYPHKAAKFAVTIYRNYFFKNRELNKFKILPISKLALLYQIYIFLDDKQPCVSVNCRRFGIKHRSHAPF